MSVLLYGAALFCLAFVVHIVIWRIRLPGRQTRALLALFFSVLGLGIAVMEYFGGQFRLLGVAAPSGAAEYAGMALLFVSLTLSYMITYTAIEADSPSLVMAMLIESAGTSGMERDRLMRELSDEKLVIPRLKDLVMDKMAVVEAGRYVLTGKGRLLAGIFTSYRRLLGADRGG